MENSPLHSYIDQSLASGVSLQDIRKSLLDNGWDSAQVDQALAEKNTPPSKPASKKIFLYVALLVIILLISLGGLYAYYKSTASKDSTAVAIIQPTSTPTASPSLTPSLSPTPEAAAGIVRVKGVVNLKETICKNMTVFSAQDPVEEKVDSNGEFTVLVSGKIPQMILAQQGSDTCFFAISLPQAPSLQFDADSTARAPFISSPGLASTNPLQAKDVSDRVSKLACYPDFLKYLKTQLLVQTFSQVATQPEFSKLQAICTKEINPVL